MVWLLLAFLDDLPSEWGPYVGGGIGGAALVAVYIIRSSSKFESRSYKRGAEYDARRAEHDAKRMERLEGKVDALDKKVDELKSDNRAEHRRKHNWLNLASSFYTELQTIRLVAKQYECREVLDLMDRLEAMRRDNPLLEDLEAITKGDIQ